MISGLSSTEFGFSLVAARERERERERARKREGGEGGMLDSFAGWSKNTKDPAFSSGVRPEVVCRKASEQAMAWFRILSV